jgi:hypothetical protein
VNIGAANHMDTFGKRILPQVIQEIRFSACAAVNFGLGRLQDYLFERFLLDFFLPDRFFGTLAPLRRASDRPIAIACFLLFTFRPERPLLSVPAFRFFIARLTFFDAPVEYFRFLAFLAMLCSL